MVLGNRSRARIAVSALAALTLGALATLAHAEIVQRGNARVTVDGAIAPTKLPRHGSAPVRVAVSAHIAPAHGADPPQLRQIAIAINRNGHFDNKGLASCSLRQIQPATTAVALQACRSALVGEGRFSARVLFSQNSPFPSSGKIYAFNGFLHGKPTIFAHIYGTDPVPTSFTLPFVLSPSKGTYGTVLRASFPEVTGNAAYVTGLSLNLGKGFSSHGAHHSYLSAGCPAPKGFPGASFPLARTTFSFSGGRQLNAVVSRSCRARG